MRRKRCVSCWNLTHNWMTTNGGPVECWECHRIALEAYKKKRARVSQLVEEPVREAGNV